MININRYNCHKLKLIEVLYNFGDVNPGVKMFKNLLA